VCFSKSLHTVANGVVQGRRESVCRPGQTSVLKHLHKYDNKKLRCCRDSTRCGRNSQLTSI